MVRPYVRHARPVLSASIPGLLSGDPFACVNAGVPGRRENGPPGRPRAPSGGTGGCRGGVGGAHPPPAGPGGPVTHRPGILRVWVAPAVDPGVPVLMPALVLPSDHIGA